MVGASHLVNCEMPNLFLTLRGKPLENWRPTLLSHLPVSRAKIEGETPKIVSDSLGRA